MDIISNSMMNSVQQRTPTKRSKHHKKYHNNIKPMKVVYISNPMKVKTSASKFMALVQELTGQDAESPPDPSRFREPGGDYGGDNNSGSGYDEINDHARVDPNNYCQGQGQGQGQVGSESSSMESFEPFDEVFTPRMIESISAMLPSVGYNYDVPYPLKASY